MTSISVTIDQLAEPIRAPEARCSPFLEFPRFKPVWWLPGGHLQTIAAAFWDHDSSAGAHQVQVMLPDGDKIVLHDDRPEAWRPGDRVAVLIHGLGGSHRSGPISRMARRLNLIGIRTFRVDLRGSGAGEQLANRSYHAGCTEDLACVMSEVASRTTGHNQSPISVVGISLGGNILLKYLGEHPQWVPPQVEKAIAINPPIDLANCVDQLNRGLNWMYDRYFARDLLSILKRRKAANPNLVMPAEAANPTTLMEFDNWYTSMIAGCGSAKDYYSSASSLPFLSQIQKPTLVISSRNDPLIPCDMFLDSKSAWSNAVELRIVEGGGHVGYFSRKGPAADRHWIESRVIECLALPSYP